MSLKQLFSVFLFFCAYGTMAQSLIQGRLLDAQDDSPIPYAVLQRSTDTRAVMTNADGAFSLELTPGDQLILRHIGYNQEIFTFDGSSEFIIRATAKTEELPTVELQGENAALDLFWDMVKIGRKQATEAQGMKSFYRLLTKEASGEPYEYLEAFYQTETGANGIESMVPKSGRFAFVTREEDFFSADLSRLLPQFRFFRTFGEVDNLPVFPSAMNRKKIESTYSIEVERLFYSSEGTTAEIHLISTDPKHKEHYVYFIDTKTKLPVRIEMRKHKLNTRPFEALDENDKVGEVLLSSTVDFGQEEGKFFVEQYRLNFEYTYFKLGYAPRTFLTEISWFGYRKGRFTLPVLYSLADYHTDYHYYGRLPDLPELWETDYAVLATSEQQKTVELLKTLDTRGNFFGDSLNHKKTFWRDRDLPMIWQRIEDKKPDQDIRSFSYINEQANHLVFDFSVNSFCQDGSAQWYVEPEFLGEESYFRENRTATALRYVQLAWKITILRADEFQQNLNESSKCYSDEELRELVANRVNALNDELFSLSSQTADGKYDEKLAEWESRYE